MQTVGRTIPRLYRGTRALNTAKNLPSNAMGLMPSDLFLWAAGVSILISLGLRLSGRRDDALFVGEWPATLATLGVVSRLASR